MANIDLLQSAQGRKTFNQRGLWGMKALFVPLIVLVVAVALFAAAKFYSSYLSGEKSKIDQENQMEMSNLIGKNVDRVVDFKERMDLALKESSAKEDYNSYLKELESLMINGARLDSLKYSSKGIDMILIADNFKTLARQNLSFRNSKYFKDLKMGQASRDENGNIKVTLKR